MPVTYPLNIGTNIDNARRIGIDAIVNARAGLQHLNRSTLDDIELYRDGQGIKDYQQRRIRWYGPHSKFFRRHRDRIEHLIASYDDMPF
jgi:hypothetical protein